MPAAGGGVGFQPGAKRVIALFSDSHWHDPDANLTLAGLRAAFNVSNATFVSMLDVEYLDSSPDLEDAPNAFSDATKSNVPAAAVSGGACSPGCCTGLGGAARPAGGPGGTCRLNFLLQSGIATTAPLVAALQAISAGTVLDITTAVANDPATPSGLDATSLFEPVRAMGEGDPTRGCPANPAKDTNDDSVTDTFTAVTVGTPVCFEIRPKPNAAIPGGVAGQTLGVRLTVLGMPGSVVLDERTITVVVPPS
jgi:hypothetical protein